jgi:hypothetical protein
MAFQDHQRQARDDATSSQARTAPGGVLCLTRALTNPSLQSQRYAAQSAQSSSACFNTVSVAWACLSGG